MDKLRENIKAMHEKMQTDINNGDRKAIAQAHNRFGELNAARKSLGLEPLVLPPDSTPAPDNHVD